MKGYNRVILMGNLARDPEVRYTSNNTAVATFSLAVNRYTKQADGQGKETADFFTIVAWGKSAEQCQKYLHKGNGVHVEGRLQTRSYEGKDGQKRYVTEVVADAAGICFVGGGDRQGGSAPVQTQPQQQNTAPRTQPRQGNGFNPNEPVTMQDFPMDISDLDNGPAQEAQEDIPF